MRAFLLITVFCFAGCANDPVVLYHDIPAAYLEKCDVPPLPDNNGEMAEAYLGAAQCAIQGNDDKDRIKSLQQSVDE